MSTARISVRYWLPVLLWMALIFAASSDSASFQHSSRIITLLLQWLIPNISEAAIHAVVVCVRKASHLGEYAILAILIWRLLVRPSSQSPYQWKWSDAARTLLLVALYAASDEFHQLFVPSREASVRDILIDSAGGLLALILLWVIGRWHQRW